MLGCPRYAAVQVCEDHGSGVCLKEHQRCCRCPGSAETEQSTGKHFDTAAGLDGIQGKGGGRGGNRDTADCTCHRRNNLQMSKDRAPLFSDGTRGSRHRRRATGWESRQRRATATAWEYLKAADVEGTRQAAHGCLALHQIYHAPQGLVEVHAAFHARYAWVKGIEELLWHSLPHDRQRKRPQLLQQAHLVHEHLTARTFMRDGFTCTSTSLLDPQQSCAAAGAQEIFCKGIAPEKVQRGNSCVPGGTQARRFISCCNAHFSFIQ